MAAMSFTGGRGKYGCMITRFPLLTVGVARAGSATLAVEGDPLGPIVPDPPHPAARIRTITAIPVMGVAVMAAFPWRATAGRARSPAPASRPGTCTSGCRPGGTRIPGRRASPGNHRSWWDSVHRRDMNALRCPRDRVPGAGQADEVLAEGIQPRPQPLRGVAARIGGDEDDP